MAQVKHNSLCNDPLSHEPKLSRARRTIPEWSKYDDEIALLAGNIASASPEEAGATAFSKRADELEQAKLQSIERDQFEAEESSKAEQIVSEVEVEKLEVELEPVEVKKEIVEESHEKEGEEGQAEEEEVLDKVEREDKCKEESRVKDKL